MLFLGWKTVRVCACVCVCVEERERERDVELIARFTLKEGWSDACILLQHWKFFCLQSCCLKIYFFLSSLSLSLSHTLSLSLSLKLKNLLSFAFFLPTSFPFNLKPFCVVVVVVVFVSTLLHLSSKSLFPLTSRWQTMPSNPRTQVSNLHQRPKQRIHSWAVIYVAH